MVLLQTTDMKGMADTFTYLTHKLDLCFFTLIESLSFVKVMILKSDLSLLCYHLII